jgi:spore coat polysaccharide biosynthesis predicted glycosyltransferase SpsG
MSDEDPTNLAQQVVEALTEKLTLDILLGSAYRHREGLQQALKQSKDMIMLHENVRGIVPLHQSVDAAITAMGVTAFEPANRC